MHHLSTTTNEAEDAKRAIENADTLLQTSLAQQDFPGNDNAIQSFEEARRHFERNYLAQILKITSGNVTRAARLAKRNRTEFYKLLQRHQLNPSLFKL